MVVDQYSSRPLYVETKDAGVETDAAKHDALLQRILRWNDGRSAQGDEWFICTHDIRCHTMVPNAAMACDVGEQVRAGQTMTSVYADTLRFTTELRNDRKQNNDVPGIETVR